MERYDIYRRTVALADSIFAYVIFLGENDDRCKIGEKFLPIINEIIVMWK